VSLAEQMNEWMNEWIYVFVGSAWSGVAGAPRPPALSLGSRVAYNKGYETLPSRRYQLLKPTPTHCADATRRHLFARAVDETGNSYGRRSPSDVDSGGSGCAQRRLLAGAVSDVDLTSRDGGGSTCWTQKPSAADLSSAVNALDDHDDMFSGLLQGGHSIQTLPDTNLWRRLWGQRIFASQCLDFAASFEISEFDRQEYTRGDNDVVLCTIVAAAMLEVHYVTAV